MATTKGADRESLRIEPLSKDTWDAYAALVERHGGVFGGCWCTWFATMPAAKTRTYEGNRAEKQTRVLDGRGHTALVMDGDEAVAWADFGSPEELPNIYHRKEYDATATRQPDYRITCIFVDKRYRRSGLARIALEGALDLIAAAGGGRVEGYPHDTAGSRVSVLYDGTRAMYEDAGFTYDRPKGAKNCVMVRDVPAS